MRARTMLCFVIILVLSAGCSKKEEPQSETPMSEAQTPEMTETMADETEDSPYINASDGTYAIITTGTDNTYNEMKALSFKETIELAGGKCIIRHPESNKSEDQIAIINELVGQNINAIAIAGNDYEDLQPALMAAMNEGVKVSSLDSGVNAKSRMVFTNHVGTETVAQTLVDAVHDISGGEGQWAVMSNNADSDPESSWIEVMKDIMNGDKYKNLELVEVVYGDDEFVESVEQARDLLLNYPDLKVICSPTTAGTMAAAKVVQDQGVSGTVKVTGLGIPSEMEDFIGEDNAHSCPYMFLWNPTEIGRLAGYVSMALVDGSITGTVGDSFTAGDMGEFTVENAADGGTEIAAKSLFKFDISNIEEWKAVY